MKMYKRDVVFAAGIVLALVALSACQPDRSTDGDVVKIEEEEDGVEVDGDRNVKVMEVTVGPRLLDCVGVAPMKCLEADGLLFYESIEGFEHEEGFSYRLKIERYDAFPGEEEPPQDASKYGYRLIEVISKTAR